MITRKNLTDDEYISAIEESNAKLSKQLAISEFQKDHLKKRNSELQQKVTELIRNSGKKT